MGGRNFTFNVSELTTRLTPSNQWEWHAPCKPEILELETKGWDASLSIGPISQIILLHQMQRADEWHDQWLKELSAAAADGTNDATEVSVWPPENANRLDVSIGLRPQRYELFRAFVTLHFGRSDLICRIAGEMRFARAGRPIE
jgi:hypothetical protein